MARSNLRFWRQSRRADLGGARTSWGALVAAFAVFLPGAVAWGGEGGAGAPGVVLNERYIETAWGFFSSPDRLDQLPAPTQFLPRGGMLLRHAARHDWTPPFDQPAVVFKWVLANLPSRVTVYPTEQYCYFLAPLGHRTIAGNLRFVDAKEGEISFAYYDVESPREYQARRFGADDRCTVTRGHGGYTVDFRAESVYFRISTVGLAVPQDLPLLPSERVVTGVLDESGIQLTLLFNEETDSFYYILNRDAAPADTFKVVADLEGGALEVGVLSRFAFYHDEWSGRRVLVGVSAEEVRANSWFDGPFDQIPPRLHMGDFLRRAYPYVDHRGGIDAHGNFLEMPDTRVAISAYQQYETLDALVTFLEQALEEHETPSERFAAMTYEPKRDFHHTLDRLGADVVERLWHRQGWAANHYGPISRTWPADHEAESSGEWPRNHDGAASLQFPKGDRK